MRSPSFFAGVAFLAELLSALVVGAAAGHLPWFAGAIVEAAMLGVLVFAGTYVGVRWAAPHQRTRRLAWSLGLLYLVVGVALFAPIQTHAVMQRPNQGGSVIGVPASVPPAVTTVALPLVLLLASILLARGLAAGCGGRLDRDA
jgi:hypothetical protein